MPIDPATLDAATISARLPAGAGLTVEVVRETGSTNADIAEAARAGRTGPCVRFALQQTVGRGRAGRAWHGAVGDSLMFSLGVPMPCPPARCAGLSLAVGVSLACTLRGFGAPVRLKWPNDLILGEGKLGGVLIELVNADEGGTYAVIGVGINVAGAKALSARTGRPVSDLAGAVAGTVDANALAAAIVAGLLDATARFARDGLAPVRDDWRALHAHEGLPVEIRDGERTLARGIARSIDADGRLLLESDGTIVPIASGDVSLRARAGTPA